jgi:single-strand DNA-binding protein
MGNYNKVILIGNLTRDPELRYTPKGTAVAKIGVAINRTWRTESGETKEEVTFVDVDAFGRQAETLGQYMKKGRPILIEGRLRLDTWEDKQTSQKRSRLGVVLEAFQFLDYGGARSADDSAPAEPRPRPAPASPPPASAPPSAPAAEPSEESTGEDDVPF